MTIVFKGGTFKIMSINQIVFDFAKRTADSIVKMFGEKCEVAIHDFSDLDKSLIYLSGTVTNRDVGSPATNLVLEELKKPSEEVEDIYNYKTYADNGVVFKSSTVFLRNQDNNVIGALCINYDINNLLSIEGMLQNVLSFSNNQEEKFNTSIHDIINEMVEEVSKTFHKPSSLLTLDEKIEFTRQLEEKGFFLIKGSTEYIATVFGVSKFTIYNYLQKIHVQEQYFKKLEAD